MGALTITVDERDPGRLQVPGSCVAADMSAVLHEALSLLAACGSQVVVEIASSADDARLVLLINDLARHAAEDDKRVVVEIADDAPPWLADAAFDQVVRIERTQLMPVASTRPPSPSAAVQSTAGTARREGRGFVASYGVGRRCAASGCRTNLSRYNEDAMCWAHEARSRLG